MSFYGINNSLKNCMYVKDKNILKDNYDNCYLSNIIFYQCVLQ